MNLFKKWIKINFLFVEVIVVLICIVLLFIYGPSFEVLLLSCVFLIVMVLRRIDFKKQVILRRIIIACFIVAAISFIAIESLVISEMGSNDRDVHDEDAVVILGAGIKGSTLSKTLKQRLNASLSYLKSNPGIPIILSGGQGKGEHISEATAMKNYLLSKGVSEDRLILEDKSRNTKENLKFSKKIFQENGLNSARILIITSDFHMYRAKYDARKNGFEAYGICSHTPLFYKAKYMIREYLAIIKTWIIDS